MVMESENERHNPTLVVSAADEAISLIDENTVAVPKRSTDETRMLTRKSLTQHRLMRWFALLLMLGTVILVWRYLSILILALWLSSICRPLLEWLVNHLWVSLFNDEETNRCSFSPLMNRCREKSSRSAIASFLLVFFVLVVILPIILIIIALTGSTLDFAANLSNSTTARNAINLLVPPNNHENGTGSATNHSFVDFIKGGKNATFNLVERFVIQRDAITDVVQLFDGKALSVLSTVAGATAQVNERTILLTERSRGYVFSSSSVFWSSWFRRTPFFYTDLNFGVERSITVLSRLNTWLHRKGLFSKQDVDWWSAWVWPVPFKD